MMKLQLSKLILSLCIGLNVTHVFAQSDTDKQVQSISQVQSALIGTNNTITTNTNGQTNAVESMTILNNIDWQQIFIVRINNQWQFSIQSKQDLTIDKISLTLDGVTITNKVNLQLINQLSPAKLDKQASQKPVQYLFSADNLMQQIQQISKGYNLLGITKSITANDYLGYQNYIYKVINVTFDWHNATSYNQSTNRFLMVYAK